MVTLEIVGNLFIVKLVMNGKISISKFKKHKDAIEYRDYLLR